MRLLSLPDEVQADPDRIEVLRSWIDGGLLSLSFAPEMEYRYEESLEATWAMLLSDIAHHVRDAIALETGGAKADVMEKLRLCLAEVIDSSRGTRKGKILVSVPKPDLPINVESDDALEMIRIVFSGMTIFVIVYVGVWLKNDAEESVWADILYDLTAMIADHLPRADANETKGVILDHLIDYLREPTTRSYTGEFREAEPGTGGNAS